MIDHCTALILRERHHQMQKGRGNIMERQRGAIEHRVFVGLVSRIRVLPSSRAAVASIIEHFGRGTCIGKSGRWPRRRERVCLSVRGIALCTHATSHKAVKIAIIMRRPSLCLSVALPSSASQRGFTATSSLFKASATNAEWIHEPLAPHKAISGSTARPPSSAKGLVS